MLCQLFIIVLIKNKSIVIVFQYKFYICIFVDVLFMSSWLTKIHVHKTLNTSNPSKLICWVFSKTFELFTGVIFDFFFFMAAGDVKNHKCVISQIVGVCSEFLENK